MNKDSYPLYALAVVAGAAVAVWAGISPLTLVFLLVCPLMMFIMMRGMNGGHEGGRGGSGHDRTDDSNVNAQRGSGITPPKQPDGSHESIEHP